MAERRTRKSFWDIEDDTKHRSGFSEPSSWTRKEYKSNYDDGQYHEFSAPGTISAPKSFDNPGRASWESVDEKPTVIMDDCFVKYDAPEAKEVGGANRYYKVMSPEFGGMEQRKYNDTFEDDRRHSHRHPVRDRSRRRGRTSGRSRSRSLSLGRGRERGRGRGWSRTRSRSRSRSNVSDRSHSRSRSPVEDRRQSYGWSNRNKGHDKSSQSCRDFIGGSCRRGSQCRFVHPNNVSRRVGDRLEDDAAESWRNRTDRGHMSKHAYSRCPEVEMQDDISDSYHGKDEQFTSKSRNAIPCKDFVRGNCRWEDTCKFSHHVTSGDSFGRSSGVRSFDKDIAQQSSHYGKPLCKFFAAGKCARTNCRFSHEDPKSDSLGAKGTKVYDRCNSQDKSSWSDDAMRVSSWNTRGWGDAPATNSNKATGWGDAHIANSNSTVGWGDAPVANSSSTVGWGDAPIANSNSNIGWGDAPVININSTPDTINGIGHPKENAKNVWEMSEWKEKSLHREKQSFSKESRSRDRDIDTTESIGKDSVANNQEQLTFLSSQLQNQGEVLNVQSRTLLEEDNSFSIKTLEQNVASVSQRQQRNHRMVEHNLVNQSVSGVFEGLEGSQNTPHSLFSEQNLNRNGESVFLWHSSTSNETNRRLNVFCPEQSNLNFPMAKIVAPLDSQDQGLNSQKAIESTENLESKVLQFLPKLNNENSARVITSQAIIPALQVVPLTEKLPSFVAQRFVNEQSQIYQGDELSNSMGVVPPFSNALTHGFPVNTKSTLLNPVKVPVNLLSAKENERETGEHGNFYIALGSDQNSIIVKQSSPLIRDMKPDNLIVKDPVSEILKQEEVLIKPEDKAQGKEIKDVQISKPSETLDSHGKVEDSSANKDEKGMRIFKNALIEFVKEILKPTWKEGRMSREVHKTVVKKVVDKVTNTIQVDHIPKTQDKAENYLSSCKLKITKLVQAYVDRSRKAKS